MVTETVLPSTRFRTRDRVGLTDHDGKLYMAWSDDETQALLYATYDGTSWSQAQSIGGTNESGEDMTGAQAASWSGVSVQGELSDTGPALMDFKGVLFAAWNALDASYIRLSRFDDENMSWRTFYGVDTHGHPTDNSPALAQIGYRGISVLWKEKDTNRIYWSVERLSEEFVKDPKNTRRYLIDGQVQFAKMRNYWDTDEKGRGVTPGFDWLTAHGPSMALAANQWSQTFFAWTGNDDNGLWYANSSDSFWNSSAVSGRQSDLPLIHTSSEFESSLPSLSPSITFTPDGKILHIFWKGRSELPMQNVYYASHDELTSGATWSDVHKTQFMTDNSPSALWFNGEIHILYRRDRGHEIHHGKIQTE